MHAVANMLDRDEVIWTKWVNGRTYDQLAAEYDLDVSNISRAIQRYKQSVPEPERDAYRARALARIEELYLAHRDKALTSTQAASLVRKLVMDEVHILGLSDPPTQHVEHEGTVTHAWTPGPSTAEILAEWRERGWLRPKAELTRLTDPQSQGGAP